MSTLKVTNIESPSGGGVSAKINDIGGGQLSNRNLIINGAMRVSQRSTSNTGETAGAYRACDRFYFEIANLGTWTVEQSTDSPEGFANSFKATCTTADASPAAADNAFFIHRIEANNLQHLDFGSSTAKDLTLSFWVKSNKVGSFSVNVLQPDAGFDMVGYARQISAADTWEYKTITIPGDTTGQITNDNGNGLQLEWFLNSGSDWSSGSHPATWTALANVNRNPSNLGVGGAVNDYFAITGVQLEVGNLATSFEHRSYADELSRCQRYYYEVCDLNYSSEGIGSGEMWETNAAYISVSFPTTMRALPSFSGFVAGTGPGYIIVYANNTVGYSNDSNSVLALQRAGVNGAMIYTNNFVDTASGVGGSIRTFPQGYAVWMEKRSSSLRINFNAEL